MNSSHLPNRLKRLFTKVVIFLVCFQLVAPGVANANLPTIDLTNTATNTGSWLADIGRELKAVTTKAVDKATETVEERVWEAMTLTAALTTRNALVLLAREAAKESLKALQGKGDPQFYEDSWKKFQKDIVDNVTGKFLDELRSATWDELGFDICDPNLNLKLEIVSGLDIPDDQDQEKPICTFTKIKGNYEAIGEKLADQYRSYEALYKDDPNKLAAFMTGKMLESGWEVASSKSTADIGIGLSVFGELSASKEAILSAEEEQRREGQGMKAKTGLTGLKIETPAFLRRGFVMNEVTAVQEVQFTELDPAMHVMSDIPMAVVAAFLNTFVSQGIKVATQKLLEYGVTDNTDEYVPPQGDVFGYNSQQKRNDRIDRTFSNSTVKKVSVNYNPKEINLLTEFVTCPQNNSSMFNCVMDHNFAQAVRMATQKEALTVAEAILEDYIDGSKPIIHKDESRNNSDNCYESGYCYSNLVKLRTARVIPIGWEIAASINATNGTNVSLNTVISGFGDSGSPYYGLINPNWILKYPKAKCEIEGYGEELLASGTNARSSYCADVKTCIKEGDNGECESWGYCAAEKNSWKFGGNECFAAYDSCKSLKMRNGSTQGYIYKTVDNRMCDADNAGCAWYTMAMARTADSSWNWTEDESTSYDHDNFSSSIIRLNKNIEAQSCSRNEEGCTQVIRTKVDYGSNQSPNSSFEEYTGTMDNADLFADINCDGGNCFLVNDVMSGEVAVSFAGGGTLYGPKISNVYKKNKRYFVVSAYIKKESASSTVSLSFNTTLKGGNSLYIKEIVDAYSSDEVTVGTWDRIYSIIEIIPNNIKESDAGFLRENDIWIQPTFTVTGGAKIDDIMVEEISFPSVSLTHSYVPYGSDSGLRNVDYVQKAPSYLGCYESMYRGVSVYGTPYDSSVSLISSAATNQDQGPFPRGCENFAGLCTAKEVGCDAYEPTDDGSDVFGIASAEDYCPSECAGYKSFKKNETFYEQEEFPIYLITRSAEKCDAQNVGCEEFTNLDELAAGGEGREYYKQLKHCVKVPENENQCAMYFTWESSENAGYQLQSHYLESDSDVTQPAVLDESINSASCSADIFARKSNPDCLEYYDEDGNASYRLSSQVVTCSENCHPYRRTMQYQDYTEFTGTQFVTVTAQSQCEQRDGVWQNNECLFMAIPGEGITCDSDSAGCREYRGNFAGDEKIILETNFSDWDNVLANLEYSNEYEGTNPSKKSMRVESRDQGPILVWPGLNQTLSTDPSAINLVQSGFGDYALSFWIKSDTTSETSNIRVLVSDGTGDPRFDSGVVNVSQTNWEYKTFNFSVGGNISTNATVEIQSIGDNVFYIDNYKIAQINDVNYLIKDSWDIPVTCDNELTSNSTTRDLPRAMVGCREYKDQDGATHYLKGFSSLCEEDKVGCEAVIDTKNTQDYQPKSIEIAANSQPVEQAGSVDPNKSYINFSADEWLYLVINDDSRCPAGSKGCTAVGKPELTINSTKTTSYIVPGGGTLVQEGGTDTVVDQKDGKEIYKEYFYKINPDNLLSSNVLCSSQEEGCEEFTDKGGSTYYFRNPNDRVCEYRQGVVGGTSVDGWFIRKSDLDDYNGDIPCDTEDYYYDGTEHVVRNDDQNYDGFTGLCENKADKCTAFIDPTDRDHAVTNDDPELLEKYSGIPYYNINDENIDKQSCNGLVDRNIGCVMLNDTSSEDLNLGNSYQTYYNVKNENTPQSPSSYSDLPALDALSCNSYDYCRAMEACLAIYEENSPDAMVQVCLNKIEQIDAAPGVTDRGAGGLNQHQYVCSDGNNLPASKALMEHNAKCTAKKLLQNDSNVVVKVKKDRTCAAWYGCKSTHWAYDSRVNDYIEECDELGLCTELASDGKCARFITTPIARNLLSSNEPISENGSYAKYINRNTGWFDLDYSGYTIVDRAPLNFYTAIDINKKYCYDGGANVFTSTSCLNNGDCGVGQTCNVPKHCRGSISENICNVDTDCNWNKCADGSYVELGNSCLGSYKCGERPDYPCDNKCEYPTENYRLVNYLDVDEDTCKNSYCGGTIDGENCSYISGRCLVAVEENKTLEESTSISCRVYPEKDSPFPANLKIGAVPRYENVKVATLAQGDINNSEYKKRDFGCFYTKYRYGSDEKTYPNYPDYNPTPDAGFCMDDSTVVCSCDLDEEKPIPGSGIGGTPQAFFPVINTSQACSTSDCGNNGLCAKADKDKTRYAGMSGYCLQYDESTVLYSESERPCLIWYPTNNMQGLNNLRDNQEEAGFYIEDEYVGTDNTPKFCLEAERWEKRHTYIARTDGSLSCGSYIGASYDGITFTQGRYRTQLASPGNFLSHEVDGSTSHFNDEDGNMMNTKLGDGKPRTYYDGSLNGERVLHQTDPWWDFFHESNYTDVFNDLSNSYRMSAPVPILNDTYLEYSAYYQDLSDEYTTSSMSVLDNIQQHAYDSIVLARTVLRQCGYRSGGSTVIRDFWKDEFLEPYEGPECPDGYRPGLTTFFDTRSYNLSRQKSSFLGPIGGHHRDMGNAIVTHHECIPEYASQEIKVNPDTGNSEPNLSWYRDSGKLASTDLLRDYTGNGHSTLGIESSTGTHIFNEGAPATKKKQCDDGQDNDGDGFKDYQKGEIATGEEDPQCSNKHDDCEYDDCQWVDVANSDSDEYFGANHKPENSCSSDQTCFEKYNCGSDLDCQDTLRCIDPYCYLKEETGVYSEGAKETKEYKEPSPIAVDHLVRIESESEYELNEVDSPICSKYVSIPKESPIYSDHYYKLKSGTEDNKSVLSSNSIGLGTCNAFDGNGSMVPLVDSPSTALTALTYSQGYSGNDTTCSFIGALPESDPVASTDISAFFAYKYLSISDSELSSINALSRDCGPASGDNMDTDNKNIYAGGTTCFDINSENNDSNSANWQLRKLFAKSDSLYSHNVGSGVLGGESAGLYAWQYDEEVPKLWDDLNKANYDAVKAPVVMGVLERDGLITTAVPNTFSLVSKEGVTHDSDVFIENDQASITALFFAWADRNAMPITSIKIDWGDGNEATGPGPQVKIKNHKPLCQRQDHEKLGSCMVGTSNIPGYACSTNVDCDGLSGLTGQNATCSTAKYDNWGDTFSSCVEDKPFEYTHSYTCPSPGSLDPCGTDPYKENCYEVKEQGEQWCRFKPRVVVFDNWDWCNKNTTNISQVGEGLNNNSDDCPIVSGQNNVGQWYNGYIYMKPNSAADQSIEDLF